MGCDESRRHSDRAQHYEACNWHNAWNAIHSACCRLEIGYEESRRQLDRAGYHESHNWQDVWHGFTSWMARAWACLGAYFLCGPIKAHLGKEAVGPLPPAACRLAQLACVSDQKACVRMCLYACQSSRSMTVYASCPMLYALLQKCHFIKPSVHSRMLCILCVCILCVRIFVCALHVYTFMCIHSCVYIHVYMWLTHPVCVCMHPMCMHPMYTYPTCVSMCICSMCMHSYVYVSYASCVCVCVCVCVCTVATVPTSPGCLASCVCAHRRHCPYHSDCCTSQLQQVPE